MNSCQLLSKTYFILLISIVPQQVELRFPHKELSDLAFYAMYGHRNVTPPKIDPPMHTDTDYVIKYYGYPAETHEVVTEDGYILTLHRIPHSKYSDDSSTKVPTLLIPGVYGSSLLFIIRGEYSPAMTLSNADLDVWLINNRGTRFSLKHKTLSYERDREYWDFSFHEMGVYDMPATVDYILSVTNAKQMYLVGYSMGGSIISIFLSDRPSYNDKIKKAFLLSPAIKMTRTTFPFGHHQVTANILLPIFEEMDMMPYTKSTTDLITYLCMNPSVYEICKLQFKSILGYDADEDPFGFIIEFLRGISGTNVKTIRHYMQLIRTNRFLHYNHGKKKNLFLYGQEESPDYNLKRITIPMTIYYSEQDFMVNGKDVLEALSWLPENIIMRHIDHFNHPHFVISKHAKELVYQPMLEEISIIEQNDVHRYDADYSSTYILTLISLLIMIFLSSLIVAITFNNDAQKKTLSEMTNA